MALYSRMTRIDEPFRVVEALPKKEVEAIDYLAVVGRCRRFLNTVVALEFGTL